MNQPEYIPIASNKTLLVATISALVISVLIYFTVILPAEYNLDPTGIGKSMGLTVLSEPVSTSANDQKARETLVPVESLDYREDLVSVTIPANKGVEYKFNLKEFGNFTYEWKSMNTSSVYFDFHGEPAGDTTGYFESYAIATTDQMRGSVTVPFDGSHGWYWKNSTNQDVVIELKTAGNYLVIGLK